MESLRDVKRRMEREIQKKRATPLRFDSMAVPTDEQYKEITSMEQYKQVLNWMLRLNEYRTGEATVANNIYMNMKPLAKEPEFSRAKSIIDRMNFATNAISYAKKNAPTFDGDCILEEIEVRFCLDEDEIQKCRYSYNGRDTYAFMMSNAYILGLFCTCESCRAAIALQTEEKINESDTRERKLLALANMKEVLFQCLLLDDVWNSENLICAKMYTVYFIDKEK